MFRRSSVTSGAVPSSRRRKNLASMSALSCFISQEAMEWGRWEGSRLDRCRGTSFRRVAEAMVADGWPGDGLPQHRNQVQDAELASVHSSVSVAPWPSLEAAEGSDDCRGGGECWIWSIARTRLVSSESVHWGL
mmetsp:Transcript_75911/g.203366  ORF Transcript_75911/g.203366 Transcript_75911/m.203366 type:complete len:134 (+) Transcript_75911:80-481(+)